jgi:hypothetical protein
MITMGLRQSTLLSSNGGDVFPNNITNEFQSMDESDSSPEIRLRNAALSGDKVTLEQAIQDDANINHADDQKRHYTFLLVGDALNQFVCYSMLERMLMLLIKMGLVYCKLQLLLE